MDKDDESIYSKYYKSMKARSQYVANVYIEECPFNPEGRCGGEIFVGIFVMESYGCGMILFRKRKINGKTGNSSATSS